MNNITDEEQAHKVCQMNNDALERLWDGICDLIYYPC